MKYFELKKNDSIIYTNLWNVAKTVLREIHSTIMPILEKLVLKSMILVSTFIKKKLRQAGVNKA